MAVLVDGHNYQFQNALGCGIPARLAQSVECQIVNLKVVGSSPTLGDHFAMKLGKLDAIAFDRLRNEIENALERGISARLAQLVEHQTLNFRVVGSSPTFGDHFVMKLGKLDGIAFRRATLSISKYI